MSYKCLAFAGQEDFLSNIVHLTNVGSMLGQRRRRWPNIKTALDQCLVWVVSCNQFSGYINAVNLYSIGYCWPTLDRPRHARFEAEWFFNNNYRRAERLAWLEGEFREWWLSISLIQAVIKIMFIYQKAYQIAPFDVLTEGNIPNNFQISSKYQSTSLFISG